MQIKVWAINTYVYWKLLKHYLSGCKFSEYRVCVVSEKKVTCKEKFHLSYKFKVKLFLKPANFLLSDVRNKKWFSMKSLIRCDSCVTQYFIMHTFLGWLRFTSVTSQLTDNQLTNTVIVNSRTPLVNFSMSTCENFNQLAVTNFCYNLLCSDKKISYH